MMLGGRSDEPSFVISNAQTVDGINVMQLNQMGDLVGEDRPRVVQNALQRYRASNLRAISMRNDSAVNLQRTRYKFAANAIYRQYSNDIVAIPCRFTAKTLRSHAVLL